MPVWTEYQAVVCCDECRVKFIEADWPQKKIIEQARVYGWKIGKKVTCPACQKKEGSDASTG